MRHPCTQIRKASNLQILLGLCQVGLNVALLQVFSGRFGLGGPFVEQLFYILLSLLLVRCLDGIHSLRMREWAHGRTCALETGVLERGRMRLCWVGLGTGAWRQGARKTVHMWLCYHCYVRTRGIRCSEALFGHVLFLQSVCSHASPAASRFPASNDSCQHAACAQLPPV